MTVEVGSVERPHSLPVAAAFAVAGTINACYFVIVFVTKIAVGEWFAYLWMVFLFATTAACWVAARDTYRRNRDRRSTAVLM